MKRMVALALCLLMLLPFAALADFDKEALRSTENCLVMIQPGTMETIICPVNQPFYGEIPEGDLMVCVDYIEKSQLDMTLIRVAVTAMVYDPMWADTVAFTVGGKQYAFAVTPESFEYDGIYMEDYYICLTDESLPFLKAVAQQKQDDPIPVTFCTEGETVLEGKIVLPGAEAAWIYDRFIDLGGKTQDLKSIRELWPCTITNAR